jgi:hypothetical protein
MDNPLAAEGNETDETGTAAPSAMDDEVENGKVRYDG